MKLWKITAIFLLACLLLLAGCKEHVHEYTSAVHPAACEADGATVYTCACGDSYSETIPAPGHSWDNGITVSEASCKEEGGVSYACTVCGAKKDVAIPRNENHVFSAGTVTKEPTCTGEGILERTCTVCGKTERESVAPTGKHTFGDLTVTKAPTCKEEGEAERLCTVCSFSEKESVLKTEEHVWGNPTVTLWETCGNDGEERTVCTVCAKEKTVVRPAAGPHAYVHTVTTEATCTLPGEAHLLCSVCGDTKTESIPALGVHDWNVTVVTQPTCTQSGSKQLTCTRCGAQQTEAVPPKADAHTWDNGKVTKNALCVIKGIKTYTCKVCKETKQEFIAPTGKHTYKQSVFREPTKDTEGIMQYTCTICNTGYTDVIPPAVPADPYHLRTGYSDSHYVDFSITGSTLTVKGKIIEEGLTHVWVRCGSDKSDRDQSRTVQVRSGEAFTFTFPLHHVKGPTYILVYTHCTGDKDNQYFSHVYNTAAVTKEDGEYRLITPSFYSDNTQLLSARPMPEDGLGTVSDAVQKFSDSLVKNEKSTYKKIQILHDWVAQNIYYDYDYMGGRTSSTWTDAEDVLKNRNTMCVGLVNILADLLRAQGIPCHTVKATIYNTPSKAGGTPTVRTSGHVLLEAYLAEEDRWMLIDPTWTSKNRYENGRFIQKEMSHLYFDVSVEFISFSQKLTGFAP